MTRPTDPPERRLPPNVPGTDLPPMAYRGGKMGGRMGNRMGGGDEPIELAIDTDRTRRLRGLASYVLFYAGVCALLVWVFYQFTNSWPVALVVVVFMTGYMLLMGHLAGRTVGADGVDPRHSDPRDPEGHRHARHDA
ncbi:MAG: hypothetical protein ACFCVE_16145 [Phycisphaerae bacterium]